MKLELLPLYLFYFVKTKLSFGNAQKHAVYRYLSFQRKWWEKLTALQFKFVALQIPSIHSSIVFNRMKNQSTQFF